MHKTLALLLLAAGLHAAQYHVSPTGSDSPGHGSESTPWRTITYALGRIAAGDELRLEAGATFAENLYIDQPVTITSDAANRATIDTPNANADGILVWNTGGVTLEHLVVLGPGMNDTAKIGVAAMADAGTHADLVFRDLDISGYHEGLDIFAWNGSPVGFTGVTIEDCTVHHNLANGGMTWADWIGGIDEIVVRRCVFSHNPGDPAQTKNSGSGWVFGGTTDGLIEHCIAHDNGGDGNATEGPVGLWAYDSARITIQFCEAYANRAKHMDGDGFDFDQNVTDSVIQYCYSHDNYGAGFLLCHAGSGTWRNNTVRYCVSENDGYGGKMGGIHYYSASSGLDDAQVYGNTVFNSVGPALWIQQSSNTTGATVRNNLFVTTGGEPLVQGNPGTGVILFQNNCYWSSGGAFNVAGYSSLAAWRSAKGQERLSGTDVGMNADPLLADPGNGGTIGDTTQLATLTAYQLQTGSPCADAGLDLQTLFGIDPGPHDFYGNAIPAGAGFAIGAHDIAAIILRAISIRAEDAQGAIALDPLIIELPGIAPTETGGTYTFEDLDPGDDHTFGLVGGAGVAN